MDEDDLHEQILQLEHEIEELARVAEGCRKLILLAKVFIAAGALWMMAAVLGLLGFDVLAMFSAIAAVIGGIVVFGSNVSTLRQTTAAIAAAERRRNALIGRLDPPIIGGTRSVGRCSC